MATLSELAWVSRILEQLDGVQAGLEIFVTSGEPLSVVPSRKMALRLAKRASYRPCWAVTRSSNINSTI